MNNTARTALTALALTLGFCATAHADACTVRLVSNEAAKADCFVAEGVEDRSSFPVMAGRAAHSQNGVVVTATGKVILMPVAATPAVMVHTTNIGASPRTSGPMHVTLSW